MSEGAYGVVRLPDFRVRKNENVPKVDAVSASHPTLSF